MWICINREDQAWHDTTRDFCLQRTCYGDMTRQRVMMKIRIFRHHCPNGLKMTIRYYFTYTTVFSGWNTIDSIIQNIKISISHYFVAIDWHKWILDKAQYKTTIYGTNITVYCPFIKYCHINFMYYLKKFHL